MDILITLGVFAGLFIIPWLIGWFIGKRRLKKQMPEGEKLDKVMKVTNEMLEKGKNKDQIYSYLLTKGIGETVGDIIIESASIYCFSNSDKSKNVLKMIKEGKPKENVILYLSSIGFDKDTSLSLYEAFLEEAKFPED